jgi:Raf kinase inhibitor-like YbhB/YbcL family protein
VAVVEFLLTSSAFTEGGTIPRRYTCDGQDRSPSLSWTGSRSLALILDDPDAPGGRFIHWLAWGIPPDTGGLAEGEAAPLEGRNDFGTVGYRGPCPPRGRGPHRYRFRLHALGEELRLTSGTGVAELERVLTGNLLAAAELVGTYER